MVYSMTAYCHRTFSSEQGTLTVELRSVNHRFLELSLKLAEELRAFESEIRSALNPLLRGKVECRMSWAARPSTTNTLHYDTQKLEALCNTFRQIQALCPESPWPTLDALIQFPGIRTETVSSENLSEAEHTHWVLASLEATIRDLEIMRSNEGKKIKDLLIDRTTECRNALHPISAQAEVLTQLYVERIQRRLSQLALEVEPERFMQEAVLQALRADIREELDRLFMHLEAVESALEQGGALGKRLDFLMQELNREANTLASKAADMNISQCALQLKLLIEQMREQIQNLV